MRELADDSRLVKIAAAEIMQRFTSIALNGEKVTGSELKKLREDLGEAIGQKLTVADMAKLCGLPDADGANTIRKWEVTGPSGPVSELLRILAMASDRYPILEMFNVFERHDVPVKDRPARQQAFREQMRGDVRRRIG